MITLKLTHYSYEEMCILEDALIHAYISIECPQSYCHGCKNEQVCSDLVAAKTYIKQKIASLETSEPDPPSDCF